MSAGSRGKEGLDDVAKRCVEAGGSAIVRPVDCTDASAVAVFAAEARDLLRALTYGSAAKASVCLASTKTSPIADHARVVDVNLVAHLNDVRLHHYCQSFSQDHGTWVNMISAGGFVATPYAAAYSASGWVARVQFGFAR
ncbi:MAG: SDR family NAD(P)-dependent oxidoreductase [Hymenobacter sp.]